METENTGTKPVIITEGRGNSKMFVVLVCIGLVVGALFFVGNAVVSFVATLPKHKTYDVNFDQQLASKCNALINSGDLTAARTLLETEETERGLPPEMSDKLDEIYSLQAKQEISKGATKEAITLLQLIPAESKLYENAQATIKSLAAPPKPKALQKAKTKPRKGTNSKHHR